MKSNRRKTNNHAMTPLNGVEIIRHMTKQDFLNLLQYEKDTGYSFNRMPKDEYIASIGDDERIPFKMAMVHNGVEMRGFLCRHSEDTAAVDMPFDHFFKIDRTIATTFPELVTPSKGLDIIRYLTKDDIIRLQRYQALCNHTIHEPITNGMIRMLPDDARIQVDLAFLGSATDMRIYTRLGSALYIPIPHFFTLSSEVRSWYCAAQDEQDAA
jgi:hypothetical protein